MPLGGNLWFLLKREQPSRTERKIGNYKSFIVITVSCCPVDLLSINFWWVMRRRGRREKKKKEKEKRT